MRYTLIIQRRAQRALERINEPDYSRITAAIQALADNPRPHGCKKLVGQEAWSFRVGEYRIIYEINDRALVVTVVRVGPRGGVYR